MSWSGPVFPGQKCSLGYGIVLWIETNCCHGPGDIQGDPIVLDTEWVDFIVNAYLIDSVTGRRVYDEAVLSRPKGRAKSELAGFLGVAEGFGPVRFSHWDKGQPVGRRVRSPLLKCLATEESQAGNTFENIAFIAGEWGPEARPEVFAGVSGIRQYQSATTLYLPQGGEIRACSSGAASKDGGKESWVCADETHLYVLREQKSMYSTVARNLGSKRMETQPWLMQTTTAYRPGEQSVAEETLTSWRKGELSPSTHVDHREARGHIDITDRAHTIRQLVDVFGPAAAWHDMDRKYRDMTDPRICPDHATSARYYLNRAMATKDAWIATDVVERQAATMVTELGCAVALGFDGSLNDDSTVLVASRMSDGFFWPVGIWEKPSGREGVEWEVPRSDVLAAIRKAFADFDVTRMYADPHEWRSDIDQLAGEFGARVISWETRRDVQMGAALDRLHSDLTNGVVSHSGDKVLINHFGNAYVRRKGPHRLVRKEHPNSNRKIDSVVGSALAYEARADAIAAGFGAETQSYAYVF